MTRRPINPGTARRRVAAVTVACIALLGAAPAAFASHDGMPVDCGEAGTFTARATQTAAGSHQAPEPGDVLVFEEGGSLTAFEVWLNGQLRFSLADTGRQSNAVSEVTCTFYNAAGAYFEITGVLTAN
jgi:hypothetical protein